MSEFFSKELRTAWEAIGWHLVGTRTEKDGITIYSMLGPGGLYRKMTIEQLLAVYKPS